MTQKLCVLQVLCHNLNLTPIICAYNLQQHLFYSIRRFAHDCRRHCVTESQLTTAKTKLYRL